MEPQLEDFDTKLQEQINSAVIWVA